MPLFSRKSRIEIAPTIHPRQAVDGTPLTNPEQNGDRRLALLGYCQSLLRGHPLEKDWKRPFGEGYGLEEVLDIVRPVFTAERSMIPIVGLRGALSFLTRNSEELGLFPLAVGITLAGERMNLEQTSGMTPQQVENAIGLAASILTKIGSGDPAVMPRTEMEQRWGRIPPDNLCMEYIAWVIVTSLRLEALGLLRPVLAALPKPAAFEDPGWYVDPLFVGGDRYWDGTDWTSRCRRGEDAPPAERLAETTRPLF